MRTHVMRYSNQSERARLLGLETHLERFPAPSKRAIGVAAVYPSTYRIGMSNLGFHFLYGRLSRSGLFRVERAFADTAPMTLESGSPLSAFSVVFFSVSYEEDYINLVRILHDAGIEPLREKRRGSPLVVAGGGAVSGNPMPLVEVADLLCLGEGEDPIASIIAALDEAGVGSVPRLIGRLAGIPGVLVPGSAAAFAGKAPAEEFAGSVILTPSTVFPDTLLVESSRGCPGRCAFCLARSLYNPFRTLPVEALERRLAAHETPVRRIGLVSTAVAAHPDFVSIVDSLLERGISVSFSSLRAEDIGERAAGAISRAGTRSASLAPESGSERIRFALGKRVHDDTYMAAAALLAASGIRNLTLYFLAGIPGEGEAEARETGRFLERFREAAAGTRTSVHLNPLVPKPWTPMQFFAMPRGEALEKSMGRVSATCRALGIRVQRKSTRSALRQALLSTGDERTGRAIVRMVTTGTSWNKALEAERVDTRFPHESKDAQTRFPWDRIEGPLSRGTLLDLYGSALEGLVNE
jgi:radical SAM superfamily enzyme YgiQ (UPF0313 family)